MDLAGIHWHDIFIKRVIEEPSLAKLTMEVSYPLDYAENDMAQDEYADGKLVFEECYCYSVHEIPASGEVCILDAAVVADEDGFSRLCLDTNWGYRELRCKDVRLIGPMSIHEKREVGPG